MKYDIVLTTDFKDLKLSRRGKVRDVYEIDDELLIVASDRISCFDVVLSNGIPYKGKVLTAISLFWFDFLKSVVPVHLITADVANFSEKLSAHRLTLEGRSMLVKKAKPFPVECVVRGYLSGSGWKEYRKKQSVCDISLPPGLRESDKLPQVLFTPSTKAEVGHDENVNQKFVEDAVGKKVADKLKVLSIALYKKAADYAESKGIIIADTKFEFGLYKDEIILIDEVLTPDSSRFWPQLEYKPGYPQPSFDKQFVRDYLETLDWDKTPPAPLLPQEIIEKTTQKYLEAYRRLTGKELIV